MKSHTGIVLSLISALWILFTFTQAVHARQKPFLVWETSIKATHSRSYMVTIKGQAGRNSGLSREAQTGNPCIRSNDFTSLGQKQSCWHYGSGVPFCPAYFLASPMNSSSVH